LRRTLSFKHFQFRRRGSFIEGTTGSYFLSQQKSGMERRYGPFRFSGERNKEGGMTLSPRVQHLKVRGISL
jgi:hypothetical protein